MSYDSQRTQLEVSNLSKSFDGIKVLTNVNLTVRKGEVHALVGENGSGKSTLIKCLSGFYEPDRGSELLIRRSDADDLAIVEPGGTGLTFVHQDLALVPTLTVAENLHLGDGGGQLRPLGWRRINAEATALMRAHGSGVLGTNIVGELSVADQTMLAIVRAVSRSEDGGRVLVLDEPTAALGDTDVDLVFKLIERLLARGLGVLYVSHRLDELYRIASRVTVLRDGASEGTFTMNELTEHDLVEKIVGRELEKFYPDRPISSSPRPPVLKVSNLSGGRRVRDVSFEVGEGEILGLCGVRGSGRSELARLLGGLQPITAGTVTVRGRKVKANSPGDAIRKGIAMVPEDRRSEGIVLSLSTKRNLTITDHSRFARPRMTIGAISSGREKAEAQALIKQFDVRPPRLDEPISLLSGGNQQKVAIAKWEQRDLSVLVLDEPVQGVDVGAKAQIFESLTAYADKGMGIIIISSDFEDIAHLCDRALVLRNGRLVADLRRPHLNRAAVTRAVHSWEVGS